MPPPPRHAAEPPAAPAFFADAERHGLLLPRHAIAIMPPPLIPLR